jgi:hypothetical protein
MNMNKKSDYAPNDHRSIVKDPTTPAYEADRVNRIEQGHPNVPPPPRPPSAPKRPSSEKKG